MMRLLQLLFIGHWHRWKIIKETPLAKVDSEATGHRYIQQCETCGKVIKRDMI